MIEFKTIKWKNFLSTGNNFTEVNLNDHNKTLIIGENGAGKSTILDALCFGLFNKPFRKITKSQLINSVNLADCRVEIQFAIGKVDWQINRGMKPTVFEIYKNGVQLNQSASAAEQQKWFEQNVLKLNYKSFTQIVVLGSSTFVPFMQLPAAGRREVIEDILDIRIFSAINWKQNKVKETENQIQSIKSNTDNVDREREKMKTLIEQGKGQELQRRQIAKRSTELKIIADILKDGGVKSTIIRKYLPVMNTLINKHLQELEFYVNFNLDDTFNETIKSRFRDEFSYASFSEGEKMRIDLALLFTWREVAKLKNSVNTNILILDEIFDSSLDGNGTADFINILRTVTDGNNVFVISHKEDMLHDKFDNVIQFKKVKNFSKPFQTNGTTT